MTGIVLGAAAFFVLFWVDLVSLKEMSVVKPLLWLASSALFVLGLILTNRDAPRAPLPVPLQIVGWALVGVFGLLLVYSLFIEIPFASAYVERGTPSRLVTGGTYALCRHPGVVWLAGLLAGVFLARRSLWQLLALPVWVGLDVLYVVLQEKLYFVKMFGSEYSDYQKRVPMLIPSGRSIGECARTIFRTGRK
jgi:protein-S-isoprenylcysteine O-methyltransferase Ste14